MTRTTVYTHLGRGKDSRYKISDVFQHTDAPKHPALTIALGGYGSMAVMEIPTGEYIDVHINGFKTNNVGEGANKYDVVVNGEDKTSGELIDLISSAVEVNVGGYWFNIPPGQSVTIDIRGKEVDEDGDN